MLSLKLLTINTVVLRALSLFVCPDASSTEVHTLELGNRVDFQWAAWFCCVAYLYSHSFPLAIYRLRPTDQLCHRID